MTRSESNETASGASATQGQAAPTLSGILAATDPLIYVLDHCGRFGYANEAGARAFCMQPSNLLGKSWQDLGVASEAAEELRRSIDEVWASTRPISREVTFLTNGQARTYVAEVSPIRATDGGVSGVVVTLHDLTPYTPPEPEHAHIGARERTLVAVAEALAKGIKLREVLGAFFDPSRGASPIGAVAVWLADPAERRATLVASQGFRPRLVAAFGRLSFDAPDLLALALRTERIQAVNDVCAPETASPVRVFQQEGFRGLLAVPLRAHGRLVGVVLFATHARHHFTQHDLSSAIVLADLFAVAIENGQLYDRLNEAERLRTEFFRSLAHELRSPVTVTKGQAQYLLRKHAADPVARTSLDAIVRQANRIGDVIEDLFMVLRLHPGPPAMTCERFDLSHAIRDVAARSSGTDEGHDVTVTSDDPLVVVADLKLINDVVRHLLSNARRYSPKGGTIDVSARHVHDSAIVSVTDHGVGIAPERQPHVFEPFYELVPPGEPGYVGIVSLGLYLCKQIVAAHGGQIWVTTTPGRGSTISFSLPLITSAAYSSNDIPA